VKSTHAAKPRSIDDYLAGLSADQRAALEKVRVAIQAAAPKAEECISYGLPAFRLDGKVLVAFKAAANHCAFHPMSGATVAAHREDLAGYDTSPGTIRFQPSEPLPARLIRKLVRARIDDRLAFSAADWGTLHPTRISPGTFEKRSRGDATSPTMVRMRNPALGGSGPPACWGG
jgi:uncharacterized protein YdhG (YjbR/CyaY superfamily)